MDRNRDARRSAMAAPNGLSRRRHRSSSLRDSPEDDGPVELQETSRLRDRKKDRDRDRDRERDRDRDRDRLSRSKRRRGERLMHGSNREDSRDDSSEESVNDEDEDEDEDGGGSGVGGGGSSIRMLPPNHPSSTASLSTSMINHRKSFSPVHNLNSNKHFRQLTALKVTDEMIGVSVPRKARTASTKRSNEWPSSCGVVGDQIHRQASTSPVRPSVSSSTPAPTSPSSSHASAVRKRLKPNGPKLRPPKMSLSTKTASSNQDEIEIEVAEVLYGMKRQPQGPTKQEITATDSIKFESRETNNKFTSDAKSRVSSPISNSPCVVPQLTSPFPQNSCSSVTSMSAAPKRKRPRPVKYEDENPSIFAVQNSPISSTAKVVADQPSKVETSSPNLEKNPGSAAENGGFAYDLPTSQAVPAAPASMEAQPEAIKPESNAVSNSRPANNESESRNVRTSIVELQSPKKESTGLRLDDKREEITLTKPNSTIPEVENHREEKFQIDLMAPPERDGEVDFISVDPKPAVVDAETDLKAVSREDDSKALKIGNKEEVQPLNLEAEKSKAAVEEAEAADLKKQTSSVVGGKERNFDLQLDLEKTESFSGNKLPHNVAKHNTEKTVQSGSVPLPMSVAGWPGGLPPMGYMGPLPGVVSMDGSSVSSAPIQPPHLFFNQPRPKRCTTHWYIARNIYNHQQLSRMNSFWPVAAGLGSLYGGAKLSNPNILPPELLGNVPGRGVNPAHDKGQGIAMFPAQSVKEKTSQATNLVDAAQRKPIVLQQALPPGPPSNILHGPAFIFPLSQQQAAPALSVRPGSVKSSNAGGAASFSASNSASLSATAATAAAAPAMSFNYPNMAGNEPQYLAILQNNAYPFPMPAHVGAQPAYRGPHAQAMPYFNGSFYSSPVLHPSQLQQQQQQQQQQPPPPSQSQQSQQGHPNTTISSGSSSSQKHLQNQQQRPHQNVVNGGSGSLQGFPASKNHPSQAIQLQQQQNLHVSRQLEPEMGGEDSPSTADSRVSRANMSIYGQNFAMPMHPPNFALMTPPSVGSASGATGASGSEKKQQQQQQGSKAGVEASQAFAMSFASLHGATVSPGIDITSMNHTILQSFPDVTRHSYQYMAVAAAAQAAQQKKNYRGPEEGKTGGGDSSNVEEERKALAGKASSNVGHSIAFSRADLTDTSGSTIPGNNVIDSSARAVNLSSTPVRSSSSAMPAAVSPANAPIPQQQMQQQMRNHQQQQPQQMYQLQKQQFSSVAPARNKTPTSNGSVYSDHLPSTSSMAAKFPNALSSFPQNLVQSSTSPAQSPQWKNSARITTSQVPSSSLASSNSSSLKNLPQKHGRTQQSHTQISFAANTKASTQSQGLQPASCNQSPSSPVMVGSPTTTTSSMSRSAGGSPRTTTSTSTGNKAGQISSLSSQQAKNSPSVPSQKSSPVGGRNVPSIIGNTHITSSSAGTKPQLQQQLQHQHQQHQQQQQQQQQQQHQHQHQQQQLYKQSIQPTQFFNAYMQPQASHSNSNSTQSPSSVYYHTSKRRPEQQQQSQGSAGTSSSGMLSLCPPVTHSNTSSNDPAKAAAAAAANNMKGGNLSSQNLMHAQFSPASLPTGISYAVPTVVQVQVKPAEQKKQPAGE